MILKNSKLIAAFTLVEILTVIAIIGTLSGLAIVSFGGVTQKAFVTKYQVFSDALKNSLLISIVLQLNFDEGTGQTAKDTWGTNNFILGNDATVEASDPTWVSNDCVSGSCLSFSKSVGQYLTGTNNLQLDFRNGITIESFFKPVSITTNGSAIMFAGTDAPDYIEFSVYYRSDGGIGFYLFDNAVATYNDYSADLKLQNAWHHVVYTYNYNDNTVTCYLDSKILTPTDYYYSSTKEQTLNYPMTIGSYILKSGNFFDGKIDTLRIYKSTLTASKIRENYYVGINKLLANKSIDNKDYSVRVVGI